MVENPFLSWRLNERHYGNLQGLNKKETVEKYGEEQVQIWRRSFGTPPPLAPMSETNDIDLSIEEYLLKQPSFVSRLKNNLQSKYSNSEDITSQIEYLQNQGLFEDFNHNEFDNYQQAIVDLFQNKVLSESQNLLLNNEKEYLEVRGESLKDTLARVKKWLRVEYVLWEDFNNILVVAHGNSLRALVKMLEKMSNEDILKYNIPTGSPILYELHGLEVVGKDFAEDEAVMKERARKVAEQSSKN